MANSNDWNRSRSGYSQDWDNDQDRNYRNEPFDSSRQRSGSSYGQDRHYSGSGSESDRYRGESESSRWDNRGRFGSTGNYPGRDESDWNNRSFRGNDYNSGYQGDDYARDRDYGNYNRGERRDWWDKTKDEVSSWFGDENAERRRRMDEREGPHRGKGPKGYTRSDDRIKEDVNDRLNDDSTVDASDIEVSVTNCEVILTGTVKNRWEKRRAEDLAEAISGVKNVENRIKVNSDTYSDSPSMNTGTTRTYRSTGETSSVGAFESNKNRN